MELQCSVQNYLWGKLGTSSEVARLASVCNKSLSIEQDKPYAELWMGTHVNGPSFVVDTNELLSVWLERNLDSLGPETRKLFGDNLPFLFKVLSVGNALSIQAHPNKKHAEELHKCFPQIYKDDNHKPELAVALTPFQALCGFRNIEQIVLFVNELPELRTVLGQQICDNLISSRNNEFETALKCAFEQLMQCDVTIIQSSLETAMKRLSHEDNGKQTLLLYPLLTKLVEEYPGDRGCWCIYFLNYITLQPGEAIFLGPNIPHAYLSGDCIECMACSDNVVRAGLTPKFIDVVTLVDMLIYESRSPNDILFRPTVEDEFTQVWAPPIQDFAVAKINVSTERLIPRSHRDSYNTIIRSSASIMLVVSGSATVCDSVETKVRRGTVLYLKASRQLTINLNSFDEDLIVYQAMCNVI